MHKAVEPKTGSFIPPEHTREKRTSVMTWLVIRFSDKSSALSVITEHLQQRFILTLRLNFLSQTFVAANETTRKIVNPLRHNDKKPLQGILI